MKTIVYLITPPVSEADSEKIKTRLLSEKIFCAYAHPDPACLALAEYALGSRGFKVTAHPPLQQATTPDQAKQVLRTLMGLNLGKVFVVLAPKDYVNLMLQSHEYAKRVEHDGSITTVWLTWERLVRIVGADDVGHLE